jgi:beta-lactamase class D
MRTFYGVIQYCCLLIMMSSSAMVLYAQQTIPPAQPRVQHHDEWKRLFDSANVQGCFVMYDTKANTYHVYNESRARTPFLPASTFKIPNSLIGLETGVISNAEFVIAWDGVRREIESWNKDHTLRSAIAVSCVPYYQELARRVGAKRMKFWLDTLRYGNADTGMVIDHFWLSGRLRTTCFEQIDFLHRLQSGLLPVSKRSANIVKDIIRLDSTANYVLRGKTGWAEAQSVGWLVGWVETRNNTYVFACTIEMSAMHQASARRAITEQIFRALKIF